MLTREKEASNADLRRTISKQNAADRRIREAALSPRYFYDDHVWLIEEMVEREYITEDNWTIVTRREWLPLRIYGGMTQVDGIRRLRKSRRDREKRGREVKLRLRNVRTEQILVF